LKENGLPLKDKKSAMFLKINDTIFELGGPPLVQVSTLISSNEFQYELSKIKEKWAEEFDSLTNFSGENIKAWTIDYVNLKYNIFQS
jgi:hypothetical protein